MSGRVCACICHRCVSLGVSTVCALCCPCLCRSIGASLSIYACLCVTVSAIIFSRFRFMKLFRLPTKSNNCANSTNVSLSFSLRMKLCKVQGHFQCGVGTSWNNFTKLQHKNHHRNYQKDSENSQKGSRKGSWRGWEGRGANICSVYVSVAKKTIRNRKPVTTETYPHIWN